MNRKKLSYNNIFFNSPNPKGNEKESIIDNQSLITKRQSFFNWAPFRAGAKPIENNITRNFFFNGPNPKGSEKEPSIDNTSLNIKRQSFFNLAPLRSERCCTEASATRVKPIKKTSDSFLSQCFLPLGSGQKSIANRALLIITYFLFFALFSSSCKKEPVETVFFNFENRAGVFITNEGNFMYGNASLSFYDIEKKRVYNHVFYARNSAPLGDVAQSMEIHNGQAFIVVNNSGKVYVADANTIEFTASITGLSSPRYIHFINDQKAYISDLHAKAINIINPSTYQKLGKIEVNNNNSDFSQHSTEQMLQFENLVFTNCWSFDNQLLVIDSNTDQVIDSIEVPAQPNSMVMDKNNKIWVLCDGGYAESPYAHERPALVKIDAQTLEIEKLFRFKLEENPSALCINGSHDTLYFINRHVFRMDVEEAQFPETPFVESSFTGVYGGFYGLSIHPTSSQVYIADAIDYQQNGIIYRYHPQGHLIDSFKAGVNPGSFCFKEE